MPEILPFLIRVALQLSKIKYKTFNHENKINFVTQDFKTCNIVGVHLHEFQLLLKLETHFTTFGNLYR